MPIYVGFKAPCHPEQELQRVEEVLDQDVYECPECRDRYELTSTPRDARTPD